MVNIIYEDDLIKVEVEKFEIPWLKIFTQEEIKEFSQCSKRLRLCIFEAINIIETTMLKELNCDKINISSFGNYVPHVHFHVQARYKNDSYFPEPTWGTKQRKSNLEIKNIDLIYKNISKQLKQERKNIDK